MNSFILVLLNSLPIFVTIVITLILKSKGVLTEQTRIGLRPLLFRFIVPFVSFRFLYNQTFTKEDIVLVLVLIGFMLIMASIYFLILSRNSWLPHIKAALILSMFGFSVGSFAYPFVQLNFSSEVFGKVVVFDTTLFVLIMIMGPIIGSFSASEERANIKTILKAIITDTVFISLILALLVNILNISLPVYIVNVLDFIAGSFVFTVLVYVGLSLKIPNLTKIKQVGLTFIWRHSAILIFLLLLTSILPVALATKQALVLTLFTPFSSFGLNYADKYNIDGDTIAQLSIGSMIFYILFYPVVVALAQNI